jgi:hypothetical protein
MELLIPGLILVALMVYASTKIKKRAAEAFEEEHIETEKYSLQKPEGFLHVINSPDYDFEAYSKEFDEGDFRIRRAKIEVDVFPGEGLDKVLERLIEGSTRSEVRSRTDTSALIETDEVANEIDQKVVYKFVAGRDTTFRLRFAVSSKHRDDYSSKIDETLESFELKTSETL